eukprot:1075419-Ditylum_brightwellii.AAC.1
MDMNVTATVVKKWQGTCREQWYGIDAVMMANWLLRQMPRQSSCRNRRDTPPADWKVYTVCQWGGGKSGLWSQPAMIRPQGRHRGRHSRQELAMEQI